MYIYITSASEDIENVGKVTGKGYRKFTDPVSWRQKTLFIFCHCPL